MLGEGVGIGMPWTRLPAGCRQKSGIVGHVYVDSFFEVWANGCAVRCLGVVAWDTTLVMQHSPLNAMVAVCCL